MLLIELDRVAKVEVFGVFGALLLWQVNLLLLTESKCILSPGFFNRIGREAPNSEGLDATQSRP